MVLREHLQILLMFMVVNSEWKISRIGLYNIMKS